MTTPAFTPGFTPGPWSVDEDDSGLFVRSGYASLYDHMLPVYVAPATEKPEQRAADAHLIAAAPDLFAALERLLELDSDCDYRVGGGADPATCPGDPPYVPGPCQWCQALLALAAARGGLR